MNTMQQEFDAVVEHLYKQGGKSVSDYQCRYKGLDGSMCAVGCRIPADVYVAGMEGRRVDVLLTEFRDVLPKEIFEYEVMFMSLQDVHDNYNASEDGDWTTYLGYMLKDVAYTYDLTFTKPQGE